jgi:hypothetical protein
MSEIIASGMESRPEINLVDAEALIKEHARLVERLKNAPLVEDQLIIGDPLKQDADIIIDRMKIVRSQVGDTHDYVLYNWLDKAVRELDEVFTARGVPIDVRKVVGLLGPRPTQVTKVAAREGKAEEGAVLGTIREHAYYLGQGRMLRRLSEQLDYLQNHPDQIYTTFPSSLEDEQRDLYQATVYYALDVLRGNKDLVRQFSKSSYCHLEYAWLDDVKQLSAYLNWIESGGGSGENVSYNNYLKACNELNHMILNPTIKAISNDFSPVKEYLQSRYITIMDGRSDCDCERVHTKELIRRKAQRIWESTGKRDDRTIKNWEIAQQFVNEYYTSIVPAIEKQDEAGRHCVHQVLNALQLGKQNGNRYHIANSFEAALIIYFLDAKKVQDCCEECHIAITEVL